MSHQYSTGQAVPYCRKVCTSESTPSAVAWLISTLPITQYPTVTTFVQSTPSAVAWLISTILVTQYPSVTQYVPVTVPPLP